MVIYYLQDHHSTPIYRSTSGRGLDSLAVKVSLRSRRNAHIASVGIYIFKNLADQAMGHLQRKALYVESIKGQGVSCCGPTLLFEHGNVPDYAYGSLDRGVNPTGTSDKGDDAVNRYRKRRVRYMELGWLSFVIDSATRCHYSGPSTYVYYDGIVRKTCLVTRQLFRRRNLRVIVMRHTGRVSANARGTPL